MQMSLKGYHVVLVRRISLRSAASVRPSSTALSLSGAFRGAGASPICLGARGALCPGHVVSSSQVGNIETDNHSHSLSRQRSIRSHQLVPKCMPLARKEAREPADSLRGNGKNMHTEKHLAPGGSEPKTLLLRRLKCIKPGLHSHEATETMVCVYVWSHFVFKPFCY